MPAEQAHEAIRSETPSTNWLGIKIRLRGLAVALPILAVLVTAFYLQPDSSGMGTHGQLHMGGCNFLNTTGWPCPSCGLTTSFSAMAHGQVALAFRAQIFGPVLLTAMLVLLVCALIEFLSAKKTLSRIAFRWWWLWLSISGWLLGWGIKAWSGYASGQFPLH